MSQLPAFSGPKSPHLTAPGLEAAPPTTQIATKVISLEVLCVGSSYIADAKYSCPIS